MRILNTVLPFKKYLLLNTQKSIQNTILNKSILNTFHHCVHVRVNVAAAHQ